MRGEGEGEGEGEDGGGVRLRVTRGPAKAESTWTTMLFTSTFGWVTATSSLGGGGSTEVLGVGALRSSLMT